MNLFFWFKKTHFHHHHHTTIVAATTTMSLSPPSSPPLLPPLSSLPQSLVVRLHHHHSTTVTTTTTILLLPLLYLPSLPLFHPTTVLSLSLSSLSLTPLCCLYCRCCRFTILSYHRHCRYHHHFIATIVIIFISIAPIIRQFIIGNFIFCEKIKFGFHHFMKS